MSFSHGVAFSDNGPGLHAARVSPILRTATVLLSRHRDPIQITYEARAGHAILQEDIDLGPESQLGLLGRQGSVSWI
jgi:hypothetical protein